MKRYLALLLIAVMVFTCASVVACDTDGRVYAYLHGYGESAAKRIVYDSDADLPVPHRDGYVFGGWYTDKACTVPFVEHTSMDKSFHLYAKWTELSSVPKHTVTLVYNDGSTADTVLTVAEGLPVSLPTPKYDGYRFDGWYMDPGCLTQYTMQPVTKDIILYAKWTKLPSSEEFTVTFVYNNGDADTSVLVANGESAPLPDLQQREGFIFDGWYLDELFTEEYSDEPILHDATLYAKWTAVEIKEEYTVIFEFYDGMRKVVTVKSGEAVQLPSNPTRSGYVFDGWYYDELCTDAYSGEPILHDTTLYAKWNELLTVTLKFGYDDKEQNIRVNDGETPVLPVPSRSGYEFVGWFADEDCTEPYTPAPLHESVTLYAKWEEIIEHTTHDFGDSYFMYVECAYAGCNVMGRNAGERLYDNMITFNSAKERDITSHYNACRTALSGTATDFAENFLLFEQDIGYLTDQYYWATLYYDVRNYNYTSVYQCYLTNFQRYYQLFIDADELLGDAFWSIYGEDREAVLGYAEMYVSAEESDVDAILEEYYNLLNSYPLNTDSINNLYGRLVNAYNKEARAYGYNNYIEYAYADVYNREYSPADTEQMHAFVKQYIAPALVAVNGMSTSVGRGANSSFYNALSSGRIVEGTISQDATNYIADYFKWLYDNSNDKTIDFYDAANDMFRTGNYFTGRGEGAYTMNVPGERMAAIYIQSGSTYDNAFTFVHEFGHYYNYLYNGEQYLSYDHDETHSQGNEMLFLAWLKENKPADVTTGMTRLEIDQLENILWTVCMSAAVDELEQAAYTGVYGGASVTGNYHNLFGRILDSYGVEASRILKANGNQAYWYYVAFDNAVYYISYAMSALPSIDLYTIAESEGLDKARDVYFKLFTYCDDEARMDAYTYSGEGGVLDYCGLDSPFEETLYRHIGDYVDAFCN